MGVELEAKLAFGVFLVLGYNLFHALYRFFQQTYWQFSGSIVAKGQCRVQTINVRWRASEIQPPGRRDFCGTSTIITDLVEFVTKPTVSLYCVSPTEAVFVDCDVDDDQLSKHPFYYAAQFRFAKRFVVIPLNSLEYLVNALESSYQPDWQSHVVMLYSTGRCGSTLLTKMLDAVPGTLSLSEPDSFATIPAKWTVPQQSELLRQITVIEAKRLLRPGTNELILKLRSQCTVQAKLMQQILPNVNMLFMYRNAHEVARSFEASMGGMTIVRVFLKYEFLATQIRAFLTNAVPDIPIFKDPAFLRSVCRSVLGWGSISWLGACHTYLKLHAEGVKIAAVRYEDLVRTPKETTTGLGAYLKLDVESSMDNIMKVLSQDSQEGAAISKANYKANRVFKPDDEAILQRVLGTISELSDPDVLLPGTIA